MFTLGEVSHRVRNLTTLTTTLLLKLDMWKSLEETESESWPAPDISPVSAQAPDM